jgi:hypothetical protein
VRSKFLWGEMTLHVQTQGIRSNYGVMQTGTLNNHSVSTNLNIIEPRSIRRYHWLCFGGESWVSRTGGQRRTASIAAFSYFSLTINPSDGLTRCAHSLFAVSICLPKSREKLTSNYHHTTSLLPLHHTLPHSAPRQQLQP